jgi:branched-chain amino acid transport system permease protein
VSDGGQNAARSRALDHWIVRGLRGWLLLGALVALAGTLVELVASPVDETVAMSALITMTLVLGLQMFFGNSGVFSFGHTAFMALGAYVSGLLTIPIELKLVLIPDAPALIRDHQTSFAVAILVALAFAAVVAFLFGIAILRLPPMAIGISTLGILLITNAVLLAATQITRGARPFYGVPASSTPAWIIGGAVVAILIARLFRESPWGLELRASREDELAAAAMGANVFRLRLAAWTLSGMLTAFGGVLYANYLTAFSPSQFYFSITFQVVVMLIVGGLTTVTGAVAGTIVVAVLSEFLRRLENGFSLGSLHVAGHIGLTQLAIGSLTILVLVFRRDGLFGRWELDELIGRASRHLFASPASPRAQLAPGSDTTLDLSRDA